MDIESPLQHSAGRLACWSMIFALMFTILLIPRHRTEKNKNPIIKGPRTYEGGILKRSPQEHPPLAVTHQKKERLFHTIITDAADRHQIDPALVKAVIMAESGYDPDAVSKRGAIGLMQLMPATATELGVEDLLDPEHNINGGVKYLKRLLNRYGGDLHLALAAYNAGSRKVKKYRGVPPFKATRYYIKKVIAYYRYYKKRDGQQRNRI